MWGTVLTSAAFGAAKAAFAPAPAFSWGEAARDVLLTPLVEEATFRVAPLAAWKGAPVGVTAIPFALAHVSPSDYLARPGFAAWRLFDTGLGGYLYERTYRRNGFAAAVLAHAAHNAAVALVTAIRS